MLDILTIVLGILDIASFVFAIRRFWRLSCALLASASVIAVVCLIWQSPAIRWIGGFHLLVLFLTGGLLWEYRRGSLNDKQRSEDDNQF